MKKSSLFYKSYEVSSFIIHCQQNEVKVKKKNKKKENITFTFVPSKSSGARYQSVTTIEVYFFKGDPYSRAKPKSPI